MINVFKKFNYGRIIVGGLILISCFILIFSMSKVDNISHYETIEASIVDYTEFTYSKFCSISDDSLSVFKGKGEKIFSKEISLETGDLLQVSFDIENQSKHQIGFYVDLYAPEYDYSGQEFMCLVEPGKNSYSGNLPYYRSKHPSKCFLRIFTLDNNANVRIENLLVNRQNVVLSHILIIQIILGILILISFTICLVFIVKVILFAKQNKTQKIIGIDGKKYNKLSGCYKLFTNSEFRMYLWITFFVLSVLIVIYHNVNLNAPLVVENGDEMSVFYYVKMIRDFGSILVNPVTGGITGGDLFDFPSSEVLSFLIIKLISFVTGNVYLITNLFYFLCYFLIAYSSAFVFRKLGISKGSTTLLSILYAFSSYIQLRYTHMWLIPYYMIPFSCMIAIHIIQGKVYEEQFSLKENKNFYNTIAISYLCAFTGLYYAFFSCALIAVAVMIHMINDSTLSIKKQLYPLWYILSTIAGVLTNVMPNLLFILLNGENLNGELSIRSSSDAEVFGMKLVQLLLPRNGHRISQLSEIAKTYNSKYPLVNENMTASLGIIASVGFIILILMLFYKKTKYKEICYLNIAVFLIATIGGVGSLISVFVKIPVRCYNRMSLIIMFLSLFIIGKVFDHFAIKLSSQRRNILLLLIMIIGVFDQTVDFVRPDYTEFKSAGSFISQIETILKKDDLVFQLPYGNWPTGSTYKHFIGYLESDSLRWSYGAMQGREEAVWQQQVAFAEVDSMVIQLKEAGYSGIYLDTSLYTKMYGEEQTLKFKNSMQKALGNRQMESEDKVLLFWDIREQ